LFAGLRHQVLRGHLLFAIETFPVALRNRKIREPVRAFFTVSQLFARGACVVMDSTVASDSQGSDFIVLGWEFSQFFKFMCRSVNS
jgi:hypothetical protein